MVPRKRLELLHLAAPEPKADILGVTFIDRLLALAFRILRYDFMETTPSPPTPQVY